MRQCGSVRAGVGMGAMSIGKENEKKMIKQESRKETVSKEKWLISTLK